MRFWSSIGFGILLLILWIAMPKVFHALEEVLLSLLSAINLVFQHAETLVASPAALAVPSVSY